MRDRNKSRKMNVDISKITEDGSIGRFHLEHWHYVAGFLMLYDVLAVNFAYFFSLLLRFDLNYSKIEPQYLDAMAKFMPIYSVVCLVVFWFMRLYKSMWRYASYSEFNRVIISSLITTAFHVIFITAFFCRMPILYYVAGPIIQFMLVLGIRFSYRFVLLLSSNYYRHTEGIETKRVMLIGAGEAGQMILRDLNKSESYRNRVVCIIDDNPNKWNRYIDGVPIVGGRESIIENVAKYDVDKIFLAIPSASAQERRDILNICKETNCELKNLPGMYQFVDGSVTATALKDVNLEDLLGRDPIQTDMTEVFEALHDKVILVTGGGGSIGSEICRQIASHNPKQLIILDIYENNAHEIKLELSDKYKDLNLVTLIGSVRDSRMLDDLFKKYKPDIVYHAAAHKHVPLMEDSPCEAIKNNALGTYKTAYAAMRNNCEKFVLISTDKAVNPTNIMGASKRLCEMVIQSFARRIEQKRADEIPPLNYHEENISCQPLDFVPETEFVAVRFGNVLGSNGSVIPRFKKQIEQGGPVTVTHPDIIRYFMTVPEAVSLVLLAGTYAHGGEIFVLDMGTPVKIDTLARNMIRLSGFKPDVDIKIEYTGLRPGEKLFEEKLMSEEGLKKTKNSLIHIGCPIPFDVDEFINQLHQLMIAVYNEEENIRDLVAQVVTTYHPAGEHGTEDKGAVYEQLIQETKEGSDDEKSTRNQIQST